MGAEELTFWEMFLSWLRVNQVGDLSGVFGLGLTLVGFWLTLLSVRRAKKAAESARDAAAATKREIRELDSVLELANIIASLDEIRRLHRQEAWEILPDRYSGVRRSLIMLRERSPRIEESQLILINEGIAVFLEIETKLTKEDFSIDQKTKTRINKNLLLNIDQLVAMLERRKMSGATL